MWVVHCVVFVVCKRACRTRVGRVSDESRGKRRRRRRRRRALDARAREARTARNRERDRDRRDAIDARARAPRRRTRARESWTPEDADRDDARRRIATRRARETARARRERRGRTVRDFEGGRGDARAMGGSGRTRRPSTRVLEATAARDDDAASRSRRAIASTSAGKRVKSPGRAGRGTAARRESEAHAKAALAAVMGAPRDVYVNLPTYSESASAHHDDEMALPVSIFDDPLLEEMPFYVETSKRKLEIGSMSPVAANRKRLSIDVPEPFDDVCESSPLGIPRRRRRLSANGRRTTLHELLSPRRTLNMGVSEESKRVHDLKPTDLDSARETPQVVAQKAVSRSQSLSSMARDADGRVSPTGAFKAALRSPEIVGPRDTLSRQLSRGLSCEKLFNTSASPARVA